MNRRISVNMIFCRAILFLWAIIVVLPILFIILQSVKTNQEFFMNIWQLPKKIMFSNYVKAWNNLGISKAFMNSFYVVGVSLFLGVFISTVNAYAFTRLKWQGRKLMLGIVMISLFLPGINALVPQFVIVRSVHMTNSLTALIMLYSLACNAFEIMILGSFMSSIPKELEESAYMDGATTYKTFIKIILPMTIPGIVTVSAFRFLSLFNDFLGPFIYLTDPGKYTVGVCMYQANIMIRYKADWTQLCAGIVIAMIPSLAVYLLFQKQIVGGATLGAVKG